MPVRTKRVIANVMKEGKGERERVCVCVCAWVGVYVRERARRKAINVLQLVAMCKLLSAYK